MNELEKALQKIANAIKDAADNKTKKELGKTAIETISKRTKSGFGVDGQRKKKLKPLKNSTVKRRSKKLLSPDTAPPTSNFTETGKSVDSMKDKAVTDGVDISVDRRAEKLIKNHPERSWFCIAKEEEKDLDSVVSDNLCDKLKKI